MIHHATREIPAESLDDCVDFYALIGFSPVDVPPGIAGRAVWLQASNGRPATQIHLMPTPGAEPNPGHVGIVCEDYERVVGALREAGHDVEVRREHWGSPRSYVRDPAGNLVELMAWAP
jgi:catechol 2,3-dioxygenase-like lactoylglutathione lyase family enzyme